MAFVQLDKAFSQFIDESYEKDENYELLVMLSMLADPNNDKVQNAIKGNKMLEDMCNEASVFSQDKEVQAMMLAEELALADWNANSTACLNEGRIRMLCELVEEGDLTIQRAAQKADMSVDKFTQEMKTLGFKKS